MRSSFPVRLAAVALSVVSALASAPVLTAQMTIDTVAVGFAGNAADPTTGYGGVAYDYRIGTTEVTNAHYATFLNAVAATDTYGLFNTNMGSQVLGGITRSGSSGNYTYTAKAGYANTPVVYVSFWDATRFSNWLNNGQGAGSTETGAYTLLGGTASPSNPTVARNGGASVWIASEDEWYKAAYYQPVGSGGPSDSYWLYPTRSDAIPNSVDLAGAAAALNAGNFPRDDGIANGINGGFALTQSTSFPSGNGAADVGSYDLSGSFFGTFDQGGNVWEWNDTLIGSNRGRRGGSWGNDVLYLRASSRLGLAPSAEGDDIGFRIASFTLVPEPSTYAALAGLLALGFALWRRRRA